MKPDLFWVRSKRMEYSSHRSQHKKHNWA